MDVKTAENQLEGMLRTAGIPKRPSYRPVEVCTLLSISSRQFAYMCEAYEPGTEGCPRDPATPNSFMLRRDRRVSHDELVSYLVRNNTHTRTYAVEPQQMSLFE